VFQEGGPVTKKEAREAKRRWSLALAEGRVVRYDDGLTLRAFLTREQAEAALVVAREDGRDASIVVVPE
jgi:hypothetical protein